MQSNTTQLHGVFLDVLGLGVVLTGQSGVGKSELALGLINRSHPLIADDVVVITKNQHGRLIGNCPDVLQDFLEVRGLGILNIRAMFGDTAIKLKKQLQLIIHLKTLKQSEYQQIDRLHGLHRQLCILGVNIPEVSIPVAPGRHLAVLVEGAVRNQMLRTTGYEAVKDFKQRQKAVILEACNET